MNPAYEQDYYLPDFTPEQKKEYWGGQPCDIYLICAVRRYPRGRMPRHYLGQKHRSRSFKARFEEHTSKRGSRLLAAMVEEGIAFRIVRIWKGTYRYEERRLKNLHNIWRLCPLCNPTSNTKGTLVARRKVWGW